MFVVVAVADVVAVDDEEAVVAVATVEEAVPTLPLDVALDLLKNVQAKMKRCGSESVIGMYSNTFGWLDERGPQFFAKRCSPMPLSGSTNEP